MIKIAVDIQGADNPPEELIGGVIKALAETDDLTVCLCCDRKIVGVADLDGQIAERLEIIDAPDVITNSEKPIGAVTSKPNSSLVKGLTLCHDGGAEAFVTCGATGAIFVGAMMILEKVESPTLIVELRKADGSPFCIADCGANVDCRPERLISFARMGRAYMRSLGVDSPRIALLSNGAEDGKGNALTKKANELLKEADIGFIGNIEGTNILTGDADVIVCDGFSGNILLKTIEGSVKAVLGEGKELLAQLPLDKERKEELGRLFKRLYNQYDYTSLGGAMLLGFRTPIIKGHGAATSATLYHIIKNAYALVNNKLISRIESEFSQT